MKDNLIFIGMPAVGKSTVGVVVAKKLGITAGSLTTSINSLVNKKYVVRKRSEEDRRVVFIGLTQKGKRAFSHHKEYHKKMTEAVLENLDEQEIPVLIKTLNGLSDFFRGYGEKSKKTG